MLSLFATRMPATMMSLLFVAVATLASARTADPLVIVLLCAGTIVSAARLELLFRGRSTHTVVTTTCDAARRLERRYAWWYLAFAVIFGCFAARTTFLPDPALRTPVAILVVGYAAGAVATAALRPAIAVPSVIVAVMPTATVLASRGDGPDAVSCVCLLALLAGGLRSLSRRHDAQRRQSAISLAFAALARRDHLTGLLNRLGLVDDVAALETAPAPIRRYAVHYMDLDDFKAVNDALGHAVGDALLRAVAERLLAVTSRYDIVARLGGDEFVVIQAAAESPDMVATRALSIERAVEQPIEAAGHELRVRVSVGSSRMSVHAAEFDELLAQADQALGEKKVSRKSDRPRSLARCA
ncbi:GGDEF domain-containing protein [Sphingomonas sp. BK069]|uniref:GGDEF domain-containing protein n=1 Tax=Sphingomonas sp. BK069 TaxID=2586979 RepID=UPI0016188658|nr:GGDEF domain-containing protein [Sphingomonas sp. BK069]MBB3348388.1 diguanylate cyclase (GGDEF)-like protein [Sphingomonas sp. BK069]